MSMLIPSFLYWAKWRILAAIESFDDAISCDDEPTTLVYDGAHIDDAGLVQIESHDE